MGLKTELHNTGVRAGEALNAAGGLFKPSTYKAAVAANAAAGPAQIAENGGGFVGGIFKVAMKPFVWGAKLVALPFTYGLKLLNGGLRETTSVLKAHPGKSAIGIAAIAAVSGAHLIAKRNASKLETQGDAVAQMQYLQTMQPQQPMLPAPANTSNSYMNNPEASQAFVDARIAADRAKGAAPSSQVDALAQRAAMPAPEASPAV